MLVTQSCPTLYDPVNHSPPGSSVHGIFQARLLEWVAISFSKACPEGLVFLRIILLTWIGVFQVDFWEAEKWQSGYGWPICPCSRRARVCVWVWVRGQPRRELLTPPSTQGVAGPHQLQDLLFFCLASVLYLPTWHCQGARPLLFANNLIIATTLVLRGENARDSFLVSRTLCPSPQRSAPAQPPTEGAEGAAPGGGPPGPPPNMTSNRRLQQTQAQVEEVGG